MTTDSAGGCFFALPLHQSQPRREDRGETQFVTAPAPCRRVRTAVVAERAGTIPGRPFATQARRKTAWSAHPDGVSGAMSAPLPWPGADPTVIFSPGPRERPRHLSIRSGGGTVVPRGELSGECRLRSPGYGTRHRRRHRAASAGQRAAGHGRLGGGTTPARRCGHICRTPEGTRRSSHCGTYPSDNPRPAPIAR